MKLHSIRIRISLQSIILNSIIILFVCFCTTYLLGYIFRNEADYYILDPALIKKIKEQGIRDNEELLYYKKQGAIFIPIRR